MRADKYKKAVLTVIAIMLAAIIYKTVINIDVTVKAQGRPAVPEARAVAKRLWDNVLTKCGDSYYYRYSSGYTTFELLELKEVSFDVVDIGLARADPANGVQWRGWAVVGSELQRKSRREPSSPRRWEIWQDGESLADLKHAFETGALFDPPKAPNAIRMTKINGRWTFESRENPLIGFETYDAEVRSHKPACSDVQ